jgi:hypothetical protein
MVMNETEAIELVKFALKVKQQNRECSIRYYNKVKNTEEYKEKRKRWNKEQYARRKMANKIGSA